MSIYVVGDLHGGQDLSMKYLNTKKWKEQKELTKYDTLVQLGDFGYIWYNKEHKGYKNDKHWQEWFASRNYTTLIIPGNHENFDLIEELPIIDKWNGKVRELVTSKGSLYLAMSGEIYTIDGYTILTICGATSTDKEYRVEGESWWQQESITQDEIDYTLDNLEKHETIDYVFSHTMPKSMIEQFLHYNMHTSTKFHCSTANFLEHIWTNVDIRYGLHCGHFHMNQCAYRKTPHRNEHGRIVWTPDIDNNFVYCHYKSVPYEIKGY